MSGSIFTIEFSCTSICSPKEDRLRNWFINSPFFHDSRREIPGGILTSVFSHKFG